jgi:hypothetical protein
MSDLQIGLQIATTCSRHLSGNSGELCGTRDKTPIRFPIVPATLCPSSILGLAFGDLR